MKRTRAILIIPNHISHAITELQKAVDQLAGIAGHHQKRFTLDGRLIGDIGEVIVAGFFDLQLNEVQQRGFDAVVISQPDKKVEIKCRRSSDRIEFDGERPQYLIVIKIEPTNERAELVYAGPGTVLNNIRPINDGKVDVSVHQLRNQFSVEEYMQDPVIPWSSMVTFVTSHNSNELIIDLQQRLLNSADIPNAVTEG
jgi:hypothetical protein